MHKVVFHPAKSIAAGLLCRGWLRRRDGAESDLSFDDRSASAFLDGYACSGGVVEPRALFDAALLQALRYMWWGDSEQRWQRIIHAVSHEAELYDAVRLAMEARVSTPLLHLVTAGHKCFVAERSARHHWPLDRRNDGLCCRQRRPVVLHERHRQVAVIEYLVEFRSARKVPAEARFIERSVPSVESPRDLLR